MMELSELPVYDDEHIRNELWTAFLAFVDIVGAIREPQISKTGSWPIVEISDGALYTR